MGCGEKVETRKIFENPDCLILRGGIGSGRRLLITTVIERVNTPVSEHWKRDEEKYRFALQVLSTAEFTFTVSVSRSLLPASNPFLVP